MDRLARSVPDWPIFAPPGRAATRILTSTPGARPHKQWRVRVCVIFNPAARGDKARRFRRHLDEIGRESVLKSTVAAGDARRLAADATREGYETVVAAGGDGTLNEVLNGIGDVPGGFERTRLGVLPLGTVNVFARELALPPKLENAWEIIKTGREIRIDLPVVEFQGAAGVERRYFAQLAGAGLDARAIELVKWQVKKAVGPLAYVLAGLHALLGPPAKIQAGAADISEQGALVLIGNGTLYGGQFRLFPDAELTDGLLDVCVLPRCDWYTLARCSPGLLLQGSLPQSATKCFRTSRLRLDSESRSPVQIDGELVGHLPATFEVERSRLRVLAPASSK
ncbi:MAG TPA: diacylglycerol kinase family protein [Verrucomicrobiae bacterium]|nr:diacylglycerol kinase family protein [Verrucomicrobiae bacterium]